MQLFGKIVYGAEKPKLFPDSVAEKSVFMGKQLLSAEKFSPLCFTTTFFRSNGITRLYFLAVEVVMKWLNLLHRPPIYRAAEFKKKKKKERKNTHFLALNRRVSRKFDFADFAWRRLGSEEDMLTYRENKR